MKKQLKVLNNQSLLDVCIQEYGSLEKLFDIAQDNQTSITGSQKNKKLNLLQLPEFDKIVSFYKQKDIYPATDFISSQETILEGIGYWNLEENFIVQ